MNTFPITKKEAEKIGSVFFKTGKPCLHGHLVERYTKGGRCIQCCFSDKSNHPDSRQRSKANIARSINAIINKKTTYIPEQPCKYGHLLRWVNSNNCVECDKSARVRHKISCKFSRIKKEYGLTKEQYENLLAKQNGKCAICNNGSPSRFSLHIDHCHKTKKVRGLLCNKCNQAIGLFNESVALFKKAIEYISS